MPSRLAATLEPFGGPTHSPRPCEEAKAAPAALIQNGYRPKQIICTCKLSRTAGLPGGMGFAPGPRGATEPPKISQHKLFEFTRFNFMLKSQ